MFSGLSSRKWKFPCSEEANRAIVEEFWENHDKWVSGLALN
jgi:hypothetical protein